MTPSEIPSLLLVPLMTGGAVLGDFLERLAGPAEPTYEAGEVISGKNQGYRITIPDDSWAPLPEDQRATDVDLELSGLNGEAVLVVFAGCDRGATLNLVVDYRRSENMGRLASLDIDEERRFDVASFVPVSVARYAGVTKAGHRETHWISTAVDGRFDVEVIVTLAGEGSAGEPAAKAIVESLQILGENEGCDTG